MFTQIVDPVGNLGLTCLVALVPVVLLLVLLAVFRVSAWLAVLIGSIVTFVLAAWVWQMPLGTGAQAYVYGSATGVWNVDWITFWGLMLFNTLNVSGVFENFRRWLISQGTLDIRVQTMLFAWAFGALLEGLVGFGYPWAVVAPILISLGLTDLDAIRGRLAAAAVRMYRPDQVYLACEAARRSRLIADFIHVAKSLHVDHRATAIAQPATTACAP